MKIKNNLFVLLVSVSILGMGCSNKDTPPAPAKTKTELLTTGSWKFSSATASGTDISNQNPPFSACKKDNVLTFSTNNNGTGNVNEGATKCNAADPTDTPFTWNWLNSETTLHISTILFTGGGSDFTLESVSETQLIVSQGYTPGAGSTILIRMVFVH